MGIRTVVVAVVAAVLLAGCTPVRPPGPLTDSAVESLIDDRLDAYWNSLDLPAGAVKPDVGTVELTNPRTYISTQVQCLRQAGLPAREVSGGFAVDPGGGVPAAERAEIQWACLRQFALDPRTNGYLSDEQLAYAWDYFDERLVPCLESLGYDVPPAPDRGSYVSDPSRGRNWNPYYDGEGIPIADDLGFIDLHCPALPAEPYAALRP